MKQETERAEAFKEAGREVDVTMIDRWLAEHYEQPSDILGKAGLLAQLTKAVVERALGAELTHHLGYAHGGEPDGGNCRNGTSAKTLIGEGGPVKIAIPRDRHSTFEPRLIAKGQKRFEGFDEQIIAMYARGLAHLPTPANYLVTVQSARRQALLVGVNLALLATANRTLPDRLAAIPELANYECFAADGHWHHAAAQDPRHAGAKLAVGHFYSLNGAPKPSGIPPAGFCSLSALS